MVTSDKILSISHTGASRLKSNNYDNSQVVYGDRGDLAEFGKKNATQIMIFLPHYVRAENNKNIERLKNH